MERDFLGLNIMEPFVATVKPEISNKENQRRFMKKVSSFPHFGSFRTGAIQDDGMNKLVTEPIKSSAFIHGSTADAFFDRGKISSIREIQAQNLYSDVKMSVSEQNFSLSLSNPSLTKPSFVGFGQNVADAPIGQVVGFTEPWNNSNSSAAASQMTIFYAGNVSVFQGISPEKAQAIMILAGNGSFLGSNKNPPPSPQAQSRVPSNVADGVFPMQPLSSQPHAKKDEQAAAKAAEISSASENRIVVPSRGPGSMPTMTPSAVPQFRKASLARFLEKRKERVMSAGPYTCEKKQPDGVNPANDNVASVTPSAARRS